MGGVDAISMQLPAMGRCGAERGGTFKTYNWWEEQVEGHELALVSAVTYVDRN
jgi:hypothetical protein